MEAGDYLHWNGCGSFLHTEVGAHSEGRVEGWKPEMGKVLLALMGSSWQLQSGHGAFRLDVPISVF